MPAPTRVASTAVSLSRTPVSSGAAEKKKKVSLGGPVIAPALRGAGAATGFDTTRPRADGSLLLGRRNGGPGEVTLSKTGELALDGKKGHAASIETARLIETGVSPFKHATDVQRSQLAEKLLGHLEEPASHKNSSSAVLNRSAAATLLLSVARTSGGETRDKAIGGYLKLLERETHLPFKTSMLVNLDAARLPLKKAQGALVEAVRDIVAPETPPYAKWFKAGDKKPHLEVRQYVMEEFWKGEIRGNKQRGMKVVSENADEVVMEGSLKDPKGGAPDTTVRLVMRKQDTDVLRDLDDPKVHLILYSGHAQLGGIVDSAVRSGPDAMRGDKFVGLFNCRGKQNLAQMKEKYPRVQVSATYSSSYADDDKHVLDELYSMIARRGDFTSLRKSLKQADMLQPKTNYVLPDDARQLALHDNDMDGLVDNSAIGPDRFFDPGSQKARGGARVFRPAPHAIDPQTLSGAKLDHAINYANTAFYYFAEENRAAPITYAKSDTIVPGGWFVSDTDEPVRITEKTRDGKKYYDVSVNSRFSDSSREVITSMVLYETQKHLCLKEGKFDAEDKLRALVLVAGYLDLHADFSDHIDEVLAGFQKKYGFGGPLLNYELMYAALKNDGDHGTATKKTVDWLKKRGVTVPA
ncbi:MAG: hypothetical protein JNK82_40245 [Myxococcaceae bacterium]|nr:hypothetical protein [Myxococcaceae bacterium]